LHNGPFAYRYPRGNGLGLKTPETIEPLNIGMGEKLRDGADGVIFAVGVMVEEALKAAEFLLQQEISLAVVDARFIKPLDRELLTSESIRTGLVVTLEENVLQGGFGSAVLELLADEGITARVLRLGLPDKFIEQGSQSELRALYGLDAQGISQAILEYFGTPTTIDSAENN